MRVRNCQARRRARAQSSLTAENEETTVHDEPRNQGSHGEPHRSSNGCYLANSRLRRSGIEVIAKRRRLATRGDCSATTGSQRRVAFEPVSPSSKRTDHVRVQAGFPHIGSGRPSTSRRPASPRLLPEVDGDGGAVGVEGGMRSVEAGVAVPRRERRQTVGGSVVGTSHSAQPRCHVAAAVPDKGEKAISGGGT
ncbi:hypothetical protein GGTG_03107 [Gaeumannomyces tritici R3-111a-1]|uniref:Uncharacterized protein n=1 Tax=Gaeumannomyces tritici (strain R3-111a-1) TaxID=644352 RepID=J3NPA1_GAET3|nr:hypothetical protein GGTG_03107 [Gaeumannomyces tritici R3-111a-1]EJT78004.1 hypothetical protein GGTG_03107 [Gaeumannomyces tritici R3-111a-1]